MPQTNKNNMNFFSNFAKGEVVNRKQRTGCIIYTRVSTKDQADNGMSLTTQKKYCEQYAIKNKLPIIQYFGGTYESAKNDERNEFVKMFDYIKQNRKAVSVILVYSFDRFSRSGTNALFLKDKLFNQGIEIISITQPGDSFTAFGKFQQNMQIMFSEMENQMRREKCVTGMKEALLRGEWPHMPPYGYDVIKNGKDRQIVVNEEGQKLRKMFFWISKNNISQSEAQRRLSEFGIKIRTQKISKILRNPFYCGILSHNLLEGKVVQGLHEKLIPDSVFIKVNQILNGNTHGYQIQKENSQIPLKNFLTCEKCKLPMSGYQVKAKKIWYYKCRTYGCCTNVSAKYIHSEFQNMLKQLQLDMSNELMNTMSKKILNNLNEFVKNNKEESEMIKEQLNVLNSKYEKLEDKYINDEIDKEMYAKHKSKYEEQIAILEKRHNANQIHTSNLSSMVENTVNFTSNILHLWEVGDYKTKTKLQKFVFPKGIQFNKKKMEVRTTSINKLILYLLRFNKGPHDPDFQKNLDHKEVPHLVELQGFEPWSGVGDDGAFYMFIDDYCRDKNGSSKPNPYPYAAW